jgi:hypothetical protein
MTRPALLLFCLLALPALMLAARPQTAGAEEIPFRYPTQEGFVIAIDDSSSRAVASDSPEGRAALDTLGAVLVGDQFRIPVRYGRTLVWNLGERMEPGMTRERHLELYREARAADAARTQPASALFLRLGLRGEEGEDRTLLARLDWVDIRLGESRTRFASDRLELPADGDIGAALRPFYEESAREILELLGPAPPRGYGEVPPAWLIEPLRYDLEIRDLPEDVRTEIVDVLTFELRHFLDYRITREEPDRLDIDYETQAPSWWLADRLEAVFEEIGYDARIEPRRYGLRIEPAGAD